MQDNTLKRMIMKEILTYGSLLSALCNKESTKEEPTLATGVHTSKAAKYLKPDKLRSTNTSMGSTLMFNNEVNMHINTYRLLLDLINLRGVCVSWVRDLESIVLLLECINHSRHGDASFVCFKIDLGELSR